MESGDRCGRQGTDRAFPFEFAKWKQLLAIHLDGAFLTTRAALREMYRAGRGGSIVYMGSVHSKEASVLKAPYVTATWERRGERAGRRALANAVCLREANWYATTRVGASEVMQISANRGECG
jgi:NAD(P)-dependent dehydrogenase (short-subunit alcohol dehydrogenase family)